MPPNRTLGSSKASDPADVLAHALADKREILLRAYRGWLPREDLEDALSQAALELVCRARRTQGAFESPLHAAHSLEQRFHSRILDRRRAQHGRSAIQTAIARAGSLEDACAVADRRADVEIAVARRIEIRELVSLTAVLSRDQRLALLHEVLLGTPSVEFCARFGWSQAKRRKTLQRARRRLARALRQGAR